VTAASDAGSLDLALVQLSIECGRPSANREEIARLLVNADLTPGTLVVLPELCTTGFPGHAPGGLDPGETPVERLYAHDLEFFRAIARRHRVGVLGGTMVPTDGRGANAAVLVSPDDGPARVYRKVHLMSQIGEAASFAAGREPVVAPVGPFRALLSVCYDLRFPELYRSTHGVGYDLITVQANWPMQRHAHWRSLLVARAIENQAWVVGVNRVGGYQSPFGPLRYLGASMVVGPRGDIVLEANDQPGVSRVRIDRDAVLSTRRQFNVLADRCVGPEASLPVEAAS
jgi:predicted amidohydrolase